MQQGLKAEAAKVAESMRELIARSGFREYYDPNTGAGHGARDFTWSGLVLDMGWMPSTAAASAT